jgi:hypothetical protein
MPPHLPAPQLSYHNLSVDALLTTLANVIEEQVSTQGGYTQRNPVYITGCVLATHVHSLGRYTQRMCSTSPSLHPLTWPCRCFFLRFHHHLTLTLVHLTLSPTDMTQVLRTCLVLVWLNVYCTCVLLLPRWRWVSYPSTSARRSQRWCPWPAAQQLCSRMGPRCAEGDVMM